MFEVGLWMLLFVHLAKFRNQKICEKHYMCNHHNYYKMHCFEVNSCINGMWLKWHQSRYFFRTFNKCCWETNNHLTLKVGISVEQSASCSLAFLIVWMSSKYWCSKKQSSLWEDPIRGQTKLWKKSSFNSKCCLKSKNSSHDTLPAPPPRAVVLIFFTPWTAPCH